MGKASRKRKENRIKGMFSLTDPVVEKYINDPIKRGSRKYDEILNEEVSKKRMDEITDKVRFLLSETSKDNLAVSGMRISDEMIMTLHRSFCRSIQLGDYETIFIDNEKLFSLLSTSKVPDIDIRSFVMENGIPHTVMPFKQFIIEYPDFENMLIGHAFLSRFYEMGILKATKEHMDFNYLLKNCNVHILSSLIYVPRECSEYCIKIQLVFIYDENKKEFVFFDSINNDQKLKLATDIQNNAGNDYIYMEVLLTKPDNNGNVSIAKNIFPSNELTTRLRETKDGKDLIFGKDLDETSRIMKLVGNLFINYILYRSTFPEFVVDGLPEHKIVNSNAHRLNIPKEIYESFDNDDKISLKECGKKMPHYRRGYFKVLQSDYFKAKRYTTVWIKPTFIHKEKFNSFETLVNKE